MGANEDLQTISATFKNPINTLESIEFVVRPDSGISDRGITEDFQINLYDSNDQLIDSYTVTPITDNNTVQTLVLESDTTPPGEVSITDAVYSDTSVTLNWENPSDPDFQNVRIYREGVLIYTSSGTEYSDTGLLPGTTYQYTITTVDSSGNESAGVSVNITTEAPNNQNLALVIDAQDTVQANQEFTVDVVLENATDIYAEDITVRYDTALFEFVSASTAAQGLTFYYQDEGTPGQLRYILASEGQAYGINGETALVTLTFRAKNTAGTGTIDFAAGLAADNHGNEYVPALTGKDITVIAADPDVNNDGQYTLGDLSIAAYDFGLTTGDLNDEDSDVDVSGTVDDLDLTLIVDAIIGAE